tara:strand:- start:74 stop:448 length:375 start_codon:yes stop_codon:yes gene_type:complete
MSYITLAFFSLSQFKSRTVLPAEIPSICVCTAPATLIWQVSELDELMLGAIAEGGGALTVVVLSIVDAELEFVLLFVSMQLLFVALSHPSANAIGTSTDKYSRARKPHIKNNKTFFILLPVSKR